MSFLKLSELAQVADVNIHVQKITDTSFMVVVQPSIKLAEKYPQLANPLQVIAAPQDLDREVMAALTVYTPVLSQAVSNIQEITDAMEAATKAAREAKTKPKTGTTPTTTASAAKPMQVVKPAPAKAPPPDLFAMGDEPAASTEPDSDELDDDELAPLED